MSVATAKSPGELLQSVLSSMQDACVRSGRSMDEITLVAVSKYKPIEHIASFVSAGQHVFGENYVQEALAKQEAFAGKDVSWHFIGTLQSNKAKYVVGKFSLIHTVDKLKLAHMLHKEADKAGIVQPVLLQVNVGCEPQKSGAAIEELETLAAEAAQLQGLDVQGLMCMPPFCQDAEESRPYFRQLYELRERLRSHTGLALPHLSMGMSADYPLAIEEGATLIRVGTALFGPRPVTESPL